MRKYFGTDGVRGRAGEFPMTADFALRLGQAAASVFMNGKSSATNRRIVIGKDTRISGYMFEAALYSGICSQGVDAILVGVLPTPAISFITRSLRADAGVVISASHNAYHDNGIKFFSGDGFKLPDSTEEELERIIENNLITPSTESIGKAYRIDHAIGRYVEFTKQSFDSTIDLRGIKIVLDCANGATYKVAPMALIELGAEVVLMGIEPNGFNINKNCGATAPEAMAAKVKAEGADIGISFDGDGDRVIMTDEKGTIVDGDAIMAICANYMKDNDLLAKDTVVATVMSNFGFERSLRERGITVLRTDVGDRYVLETMRAGGYNLGGEQSGHLLFTDFNTTGDGLVSALQLLKVLVRTGKPLSELRAIVEVYPQFLLNVHVRARIPLDDLPETAAIIAATEERLGNTGRVLVRYSGTENKLRVMIEAEDAGSCKSLAGEIGDIAVKEIEAKLQGGA